MIIGDAMAMREATRAGRITQKDVFLVGNGPAPQVPGAFGRPRPAPVDIFAAFEEGDYEELQKRIAALPSTQILNAAVARARRGAP